jgi:threonine synthase
MRLERGIVFITF